MGPLSAGGKAFCVVYAALGLPASLALVATLRHCLLPLFSRPVAWVAVRWQLAPARAALLQAAGLGLLVAGTFVLLPALVLWGVQGDCSLLEAVYFCFGSLSTIGLGDLMPGRGRDLHPVLYYLGQIALLGESSCQGAPRGREEGRGARTTTPINQSRGRLASQVGDPALGGGVGVAVGRIQVAVLSELSGVRCQGESPGWEVGREHHRHPKSCPSNLSYSGYLLLGLLAMLLAVETFSELPQVRAMVKFFGSSGPVTAEDQGGILGQDELTLSTLPPSTTAPEQTPAC